MVISGAIISQDTTNGNRSKDEAAQEMLWQLVQSDMKQVEQLWNQSVIPALQKIGFLKGELRFAYDETEDIEQLFRFTTGLMPYKEVDNQWLEDTFGVKVTNDTPAGAYSTDLSLIATGKF